MSLFKTASKAMLGAAIAGLFAIGSTGAAQAAATATFQIQNSSGTTLTRASASCTGGSISAPSSISSGSTVTFTGSTTGSTTLCSVRYTTNSSSGNKGCQFQVQAISGGGFASTNAYQGSPAPTCSITSESGSGSNYTGSFRQSP